MESGSQSVKHKNPNETKGEPRYSNKNRPRRKLKRLKVFLHRGLKPRWGLLKKRVIPRQTSPKQPTKTKGGSRGIRKQKKSPKAEKNKTHNEMLV